MLLALVAQSWLRVVVQQILLSGVPEPCLPRFLIEIAGRPKRLETPCLGSELPSMTGSSESHGCSPAVDSRPDCC